MNCQECHDFIDPYIDNELDVAAAILVSQHLRDCSQCQPLLESRKALRALLNNPQLQFEVPDSLRRKIQSALPDARSSAKHQSYRRSFIPWFSVPLALAAAVHRCAWAGVLESRGDARSLARQRARGGSSLGSRSLLACHSPSRSSFDRSAYGQTLVRRKAQILPACSRFHDPRLPFDRWPVGLYKWSRSRCARLPA